MDISLGTGSSAAEDGHAGACRHINCYVEALGKEAKGQVQIVGADGFETFSTLTGTGPVRRIFPVTDSECLVIGGRILSRLDQTGTETVIGAIPSDGMVTMARNRESPTPTVAIVCDGLVSYYNGGVLTPSTDPDLPPVISVTALDGYFSFLTADGRHFASGLDASDVDALSYAAAESNPDPGVRNFTRDRDLLFFGTRSLEAWQNTGGDPYPFERVTTRDVGCLAADSVSDLDQTIAWVAHDGTVRMLEGYDAKIISNQYVHNLINDEPSPTAMTACSWQLRGHTFYALSGTAFTVVYNATTGKWHDRQSYGLDRWRGRCAARFGNKILIGDYAESRVYEMRHGIETEAGAHLVATIQTPPVHAFPYRLMHAAAYLDVVPGVGAGEIMFDYSDDGAHAFSTQRTVSIGAEGQRLKRFKFMRLGVSRSRTYRISMSSAVRRCALGLSLDAQKLGA